MHNMVNRIIVVFVTNSLQWRHNGHDGVSNHQPQDCLLNRLFGRRSKETSKPRVTGLCAGNSPVTGEFPAQRASNAENVSIWWRHHIHHLRVSCTRFTNIHIGHLVLVFSCDQAALQMVFSVCPSVPPSVCPSHLFDYNVITNDQRKVHAKGQGQRSKVKVTEVTTQLNRFRTVTPVWIHIWWWNDAYSLMLLRRGVLLFFKVIRQISRSHGSKNRRIWPRLGVSGL